MKPIRDWVKRLKGHKNNTRFGREIGLSEGAIRDLLSEDSLKLYNSETLGRLLEADPDPERRGEQIVIAYLRYLAKMPRVYHTNRSAKLITNALDLSSDVADLELESE